MRIGLHERYTDTTSHSRKKSSGNCNDTNLRFERINHVVNCDGAISDWYENGSGQDNNAEVETMRAHVS